MYQIDLKEESIKIGDKTFCYIKYPDSELMSVEIENIHEYPDLSLTVPDFPENLSVTVFPEDGFGANPFNLLTFEKHGPDNLKVVFSCHQPTKFWNGEYGVAIFMGALSKVIAEDEMAWLEDFDIRDYNREIRIRYLIGNTVKISHVIEKVREIVNGYLEQAKRKLIGTIWQEKFEKDESTFCKDLLHPLLIKMGFLDVRYTHGTTEFGKDFTFSEFTPFGGLRHYAVQVKAGSVKGNVNGDIDELLGQLDDAFKIPYEDINSGEKRFVSTFIIAISGYFTSNAKTKILEKMPSNFRGNVYFIDKDKVLELIEKYWTRIVQ